MDLLDRYEVAEQLGEGRSSTVYAATDRRLDRQVALKVLRRDALDVTPSLAEEVEREARWLGRLAHPHIIPLHDFGEAGAHGPVLVMHRAQRSLQARLAHGRPSPDEVIGLGAQIAVALDHCADDGVAHRDLKPSNVLLGGGGHAFLADFASAAAYDDDRRWGRVEGSLPFMSPEQLALGHGGDAAETPPAGRRRCDQFAFGVLLYQLLTGALPHAGLSIGQPEAMQACTGLHVLMGKEVVPPSARDPRLPTAVDEAFRRMLARAPEQRFEANRAAVDALDHALASASDRLTPNQAVVRPLVGLCCCSAVDLLVVQALGRLLRGFAAALMIEDHARPPAEADQVEHRMADADFLLVIFSDRAAPEMAERCDWRYWLRFVDKPVMTLTLDNCRLPYALFDRPVIEADQRGLDAVAGEIADHARRALTLPGAAVTTALTAAPVAMTGPPPSPALPPISRPPAEPLANDYPTLFETARLRHAEDLRRRQRALGG